MRLRFLITPVPLLLAATAIASTSLTVDTAIALAKEKNPELAAARSLIKEAETRARTTGRLANPDLEAELAGGEDFEGRVSIGLTQRFPLTTRLALERKLSSIDVEAAKLELRNRERQLAVAVRTAVYELAAARESLAVARRRTELAEAFTASLTTSATEGFGSTLEVQQATLETQRNRIAEQSFHIDEVEAAARLCKLISLPAESSIVIPNLPELPARVPTAQPAGRRADLELAELACRAGATELSLAKATRWEDVGVGLFVEGERFRDEPEGIEPEALVGLRFSVALPFWQNGKGKVSEKSAAEKQLTQQLDAVRWSIRNEPLIAHRLMSSHHRSAAFARDKIVPSARKLSSDMEAAYLRAEADIQDVFRIRERLAEVESSALEARKMYFISYSEWLGTLGEQTPNP